MSGGRDHVAPRTPLPFLKGDPKSNSRDRTPKCGVEKPSQKKEEVTVQNKMVYKVSQVSRLHR